MRNHQKFPQNIPCSSMHEGDLGTELDSNRVSHFADGEDTVSDF